MFGKYLLYGRCSTVLLLSSTVLRQCRDCYPSEPIIFVHMGAGSEAVVKERSKEKGRKRTETERLEAKREKKGRKDR